MTTDPNQDNSKKRRCNSFKAHYECSNYGVMERRIALGVIYKQYAEALGMRNQQWAALTQSLRAFVSYPFDVSNARTTGSVLLRCLGPRVMNSKYAPWYGQELWPYERWGRPRIASILAHAGQSGYAGSLTRSGSNRTT